MTPSPLPPHHPPTPRSSLPHSLASDINNVLSALPTSLFYDHPSFRQKPREQGEFTCAREFYRYVSATCECVESERAASTCDHHERGAERAGGHDNQTGLTRYEACWSARADFGVASLELRESTRGVSVICFAVVTSRLPFQCRQHLAFRWPKLLQKKDGCIRSM